MFLFKPLILFIYQLVLILLLLSHYYLYFLWCFVFFDIVRRRTKQRKSLAVKQILDCISSNTNKTMYFLFYFYWPEFTFFKMNKCDVRSSNLNPCIYIIMHVPTNWVMLTGITLAFIIYNIIECMYVSRLNTFFTPINLLFQSNFSKDFSSTFFPIMLNSNMWLMNGSQHEHTF